MAAVIALGACGTTTSATTMDGMQAGSAPRAGVTASSGASEPAAAPDVMFAQMMIPHHEQAVEMADMALANRSASAAVTALARRIKAAQAPEIATMTGWLTAWGAPEAMGMDHGTDGMMSETQMGQLSSATGQAFDTLWLDLMVAHHEGAVTMSEDILSTTKDTRVATLATSIVTGQTAEIAEMKAMLG